MRIVCLSAEAADICFRLGAEADVVAVSAFAPKQPQKRVVSGFSHGNIENIVQTDPELVITFSDVQARLADSLIKAGVPVLALNHFTVAGVAGAIRLLGRVLGREEPGETLANMFLGELRKLAYVPMVRPRVYFEEWDEPMVAGISMDLRDHTDGRWRRYICRANVQESGAEGGLPRRNCGGKPSDYPGQLVWKGRRYQLDPKPQKFFLY